ncbi:MAG: hypothetical protein E7640_01205 [Ruminococcaceae bacterium]|nr:hypothetical protein [Oscillospiraceae bacterium]
MLKKLMRKTGLGSRFIDDLEFRILLTAVFSFAFNIIYAIYNQILGSISDTLWFTIISNYYIILGAMRLGVVYCHRQNKDAPSREKASPLTEQSIMKFCGILLIALALEFSVTVYLSLKLGIATKYNTLIMISIAVYTAVRMIFAFKNMIRAHKNRSVLLSMLRDISCADAAASVFTLVRSLTVSIDGIFLPTALTLSIGLAVLFFVLSLGINMLRSSKNP